MRCRVGERREAGLDLREFFLQGNKIKNIFCPPQRNDRCLGPNELLHDPLLPISLEEINPETVGIFIFVWIYVR
jgi:hypothetical protein